ncbi:LOW QUALITY PROTEIN: hypothetical protein V2J09_003955 [Rumex salicifolius]
MEALAKLQEDLTDWNMNVFRNIHKRKSRLLIRLKGVAKALDRKAYIFLLSLQRELRDELEKPLEEEELLRFQKAREKWIIHEDRNTCYFHASTLIQRGTTSIAYRTTKVDDQEALKEMAANFYEKLYKEEGSSSAITPLLTEGFPRISHFDLLSLQEPFNDYEIWEIVKPMIPLKAPGVDDFNAGFYQKKWVEVRTVSDQVS